MSVRRVAARVSLYGRVARIRRWLYGMRKAAISWEKNHAEKLAAVGFKGSRAAPTTFYNPATKVRLVVHGDDFTFSGTQVELERIRGLFKKWYDVKDRGNMRSGTRDIKEVVILGRILKFTEMGLEYTADGKHRDAILEELGLESESKSLGRGRDSGQELVTYSTWPESQCLSEFTRTRLPPRRWGLDVFEVLMGPRIGTRTEDRDQEDQWTRQPRRLSDQAKGVQVLRTFAESFRNKMEVDYPKV